LVRELDEELGLAVDPAAARRFTALTFDFAFAGGPTDMVRAFYEVELPADDLADLSVREGREMRVMSAREALDSGIRVAPYDSFALWMHANRSR
ncbi:MAG: hypothetical protein JJ899_10540, partial [Alphaproteobacteria bacterium]|nr:hypothetical protein [Alphaproteobacteria bacterium]